MKCRYSIVVLALAGIVMVSTNLARGQYSGSSAEPYVSGTGTTVMSRTPETMRMKIDVSGSAKSMKEAVAKLKTVSDAATSKLIELKAEKGSIKVGPPRIAEEVDDQRRQMEMMVRQRMRAGGKKPKAAPEPPVVVTTTITAEWKLSGKDPADLLIESREIEGSVKAADLGGLAKKTTELSEEQQEMEEEMGEQYSGMRDDGRPKPGEPTFLYLAKVDDAQRATALKEAFTKARNDAEELSKSAGGSLGRLRGLQSHVSANDSDNSGYSPYSGMRRYMMSQMIGREGANSTEALGASPSEVAMTFVVIANFDLAGP